MKLEITISIIGAIVSVIIAVISSLFVNRNNIILQTRKLKEEHYINYIESLHNLASNNKDSKAVKNYTFYRDKLFIIPSENVVKAMLEYEEKAVGVSNPKHDVYLRNLVIEIRKDLKIKDKEYPNIYLKKG